MRGTGQRGYNVEVMERVGVVTLAVLRRACTLQVVVVVAFACVEVILEIGSRSRGVRKPSPTL